MKLKDNIRFFLEKAAESDSYIRISMDRSEVSFKLASCERSIWWSFPTHNKKALARARRKVNKLKQVVDALHTYLWEFESKD